MLCLYTIILTHWVGSLHKQPCTEKPWGLDHLEGKDSIVRKQATSEKTSKVLQLEQIPAFPAVM